MYLAKIGTYRNNSQAGSNIIQIPQITMCLHLHAILQPLSDVESLSCFPLGFQLL